MSPYVSTRMPGELAEIMTEISDGVVRQLGELSLLKEIAEELPPVQAALVRAALEMPGFRLKAAREKYDALAELQSEMVPHEKINIEEALYERGVTAAWYVDQSVRRRKHELVVYYVKKQSADRA